MLAGEQKHKTNKQIIDFPFPVTHLFGLHYVRKCPLRFMIDLRETIECVKQEPHVQIRNNDIKSLHTMIIQVYTELPIEVYFWKTRGSWLTPLYRPYAKVKSILYELGPTHLHLVFWWFKMGIPECLQTGRHFVSLISVLAAMFCDHNARQEVVPRLSPRPRCSAGTPGRFQGNLVLSRI